MRHKIYRHLNRFLCSLLGHPTWKVSHWDAQECGCGKVYYE